MLLSFLLAARPADAPRLLIAPLIPLKPGGPAPSQALANRIAQELDEDGRTAAVVWGITDPVFRPLALAGKLGDVPDLPTRAQALDVARRLGAPYVLLFRSERKDGKLQASAELLQDGRTLWKDAQTMGALRRGAQSDDDAGSIARTWAVMMAGGPLKDLVPKKTLSVPDATPGQGPIATPETTPSPPVVPKDDNGAALKGRIDALTRDGRPEAARALARDAVDASPLSPAPRTILVGLLFAQGDATGAAREARRAADLLPERPELRFDAVRRLVAVGDLGAAHDELNELRARGSDDKGARLLAAEVALAEDDAPTAVRESEALLKAQDDPQAHLLRGLGRARLGGGEGAATDLKAWAAATTDPLARAEGYAYARKALGAMAERAAGAMPGLLRRAATQPKSGAVRDELDEAQRQAQARATAWTAVPCPEGERKGYDAWSLAHRLMALVAADLRAFLAGGGDDALTSARIDLGEAQRAMREAEGK